MSDPAKLHVESKRERIPPPRPVSVVDATPTTAAPATRAIAPPQQSRADREAILTLQRTVGNAIVQRRLHDLQRDDLPPPPTKDPSAEEPKQEKLPDAAEKVLKHYAEKYLGPLKDEAKKRLADAWRESPAGVIAAGAIIGGAGVGYLVGTKSALPGLPAIPLDVLGGPFEGATIQLKLDGPVTSPEAFKFTITFKEKGGKKRHVPPDALKLPTIDTFANPEAIAAEVDGPAFETETPDAENLGGSNLPNLVRLIGNGMLEAGRRKDPRPYIDLGELPPTPPGFVGGLQRIIDLLIAAAPATLGKIEQVNFRVYRGGKLFRFIPVPVSRRKEAESAEE